MVEQWIAKQDIAKRNIWILQIRLKKIHPTQ